MKRLRRMVVDHDSTAGRRFDVAVQVIIVLSLIAFAIETLPNLPRPMERLLHTFEIVAVGLFTAEYILRLWASRPHGR